MAALRDAAPLRGAGFFPVLQILAVVPMEEGQRFYTKERKQEKTDIYQTLARCLHSVVHFILYKS